MKKEDWILENKEKFKDISQEHEGHILDWIDANINNINFKELDFDMAYIQSMTWFGGEVKKKGSGSTNILYKKGEFALVELLDQESKDWEGYYMHHCVSHYKTQTIYSVRNLKDQKPIITLEIENKKIKQIKGKYNKGVSPKYLDILLYFLNTLNFNIENKDLEKMNYTKVNNSQLEILKNIFHKIQIVTIASQNFVYNNKLLKVINEKELQKCFVYNFKMLNLENRESHRDLLTLIIDILTINNNEYIEKIYNKKLIPEIYWGDILITSIMNKSYKITNSLLDNGLNIQKGRYNTYEINKIIIDTPFEILNQLNIKDDILLMGNNRFSYIIDGILKSQFLSIAEKEKKINYFVDVIGEDKIIIDYKPLLNPLDFYKLDQKIVDRIVNLFYLEFEYNFYRNNILMILKEKDLDKIKYILEFQSKYIQKNIDINIYSFKKVLEDFRVLMFMDMKKDINKLYKKIYLLPQFPSKEISLRIYGSLINPIYKIFIHLKY